VLLSRLDRVTGDLVSQAEAVQGKRPARGRSGAHAPASPSAKNPPASNRGVKSTKRGRPSSNVTVRR
jgi:hypothetical protein